MAGEKAGGGNVSRVLGVGLYIGHCGHDGSQYHVPVFCGITVESYFHRLKYIYLCGEGEKGIGKPTGYLATLFGCAAELEGHYVLYHVRF